MMRGHLSHSKRADRRQQVLFDDVANSGRAGREVRMEGYVPSMRSAEPKEFTNSIPLGPFFVAFPNLKHALENNIAIKTQARSCTILPNFIGYASSQLRLHFLKILNLLLYLFIKTAFHGA